MKFFLVVLLPTLVASCSVGSIRKSPPSHEQTTKVQKLNNIYNLVSAEKKKGVSDSSQTTDYYSLKSITCRLTTIDVPHPHTVQDYVAELSNDFIGKKSSPDGERIEVRLVNDGLNSNSAFYDFEVEYLYKNKATLVKTRTDFRWAFAAHVACSNAKEAFNRAVYDNVNEAIKVLELK